MGNLKQANTGYVFEGLIKKLRLTEKAKNEKRKLLLIILKTKIKKNHY